MAARSFRPDVGSFDTYAQMRAVGAIRRGEAAAQRAVAGRLGSKSPPRVVSLNLPVGNDGNAELGDLLPDTSETDDHPCALNDVLRRLPRANRSSSNCATFAGSRSTKSRPVSGVSQMQVSPIERAALSRLRRALAL